MYSERDSYKAICHGVTGGVATGQQKIPLSRAYPGGEEEGTLYL